jgi:hypothetical protein
MDGQVLKSRKQKATPKLSGIVIDDAVAEFTGEWLTSNAAGSLSGSNYRHDGNSDRGKKTATFQLKLNQAGRYDVRLLYSSHANRASNVRVTIHSAEGVTTLKLNQRLPVLKNGEPRSLGQFSFKSGQTASVTLSNQGADGYVSIDGLQLLRLTPVAP